MLTNMETSHPVWIVIFILFLQASLNSEVQCALQGGDIVTEKHFTAGPISNEQSSETTSETIAAESTEDTTNNNAFTPTRNATTSSVENTSSARTTMSTSPETPFKWALLASKWLHMYGGVITLILGIPGNLLACGILLRPKLRALPGNIFLIFMTLSDFIFIFSTQFLIHWLKLVSGTDFLTINDWLCKIITGVKYISSDFSKSNLFGLTMERFFSICFPMKALSIVTPKLRRIYIVGVFLWAIAVNTLDFTSRSVINVGSSLKCEFENSFLAYVKNGLHLAHNVTASVGVIIFNVLIVVALLRQKKTVEQDLASGQKAANHGNVTRMLLTVSFVFILCTTPACITQIIRSGGYFTPVQGLVMQYLMFCVFVNHAINVLLYFCSASVFRAEMARVFCGAKGSLKRRAGSSTDGRTAKTDLSTIS